MFNIIMIAMMNNIIMIAMMINIIVTNTSLLPYSTYLHLDFHLCSMIKLKEHSREICYSIMVPIILFFSCPGQLNK